ncbi:hypothetical protein BHE74_00032555 [Ensete ventricosum]|nr:hypothetical protein GW17_00034107 [Ensete ventricosum]RWW60442.1 hypothetical protein BHE74_00032555 [Ensete ventricosum]RZS08972.1 hypothetical protein BHM03_00040017 [Ensete ventricosum]
MNDCTLSFAALVHGLTQSIHLHVHPAHPFPLDSGLIRSSHQRILSTAVSSIALLLCCSLFFGYAECRA